MIKNQGHEINRKDREFHRKKKAISRNDLEIP